ncbi:MAG: hypothetical protein ACXWUP_11260, partial [Allosphingosinicella sp.]
SAERERGKPASFDRATGAVHGSGSGAGGGNPGEDYDDDPQAGGGVDPDPEAAREPDATERRQ